MEFNKSNLPIRAAIFDFDGTLIDSLHVWDDIDNESFAKRGISVPEDFARVTATMTPKQVADYVIERFGFEDSPEDLMQEWSAMAFDAYANRLHLRKGAKSYIENLDSKGINLVLVTTLSKSLCEPSLKRTGIFKYFNTMFFGEDLDSVGKNSPKFYIDLAREIGVNPVDCVVFEDSFKALYSAQQAGMRTCAILDDVKNDFKEDSLLSNCLAVFSDFYDAPKI